MKKYFCTFFVIVSLISCQTTRSKKFFSDRLDRQLIFDHFLTTLEVNYVKPVNAFDVIHQTFKNIEKFESEGKMTVTAQRSGSFKVRCNNADLEYFADEIKNRHVDEIVELVSPCFNKLSLVYRTNAFDAFIDKILCSLEYPGELKTKSDLALEAQTRLGQVGAVGLEIGFEKYKLKVMAIFPNSPAEEAGILPGDQLSSINGESTESMPLFLVARKLQGDIGSVVTLSLIKKNLDKPITIEVKRRFVQYPHILFKEQDGGLIVSMPVIFEQSFLDIKEKISEGKKYRFVMIDLRKCYQGYLEPAANIANLFVENGLIFAAKNLRKDQVHEKRADLSVSKYRGKILILTSNNTGGAGEIITKALKVHRGAEIFGQKTAGRGLARSVLHSYEIGNVILPTMLLYGPTWHTIQDDPTFPDIEVQEIGDAEQIALNSLKP